VLIVLAHALVRARDWTRLGEVKADLRKRRNVDNQSVLGRIDLDAAIHKGDWRTGERHLPDSFLLPEDREYAAAIYELKSTDASVLLTERDEAKARAEELRKETGKGRTAIPLASTLYE
jgi:hypothetical protein